jgi:hypothetical protein
VARSLGGGEVKARAPPGSEVGRPAAAARGHPGRARAGAVRPKAWPRGPSHGPAAPSASGRAPGAWYWQTTMMRPTDQLTRPLGQYVWAQPILLEPFQTTCGPRVKAASARRAGPPAGSRT